MSINEIVALVLLILFGVPVAFILAGLVAGLLGLYDPDLQDDTDTDGEADDE